MNSDLIYYHSFRGAYRSLFLVKKRDTDYSVSLRFLLLRRSLTSFSQPTQIVLDFTTLLVICFTPSSRSLHFAKRKISAHYFGDTSAFPHFIRSAYATLLGFSSLSGKCFITAKACHSACPRLFEFIRLLLISLYGKSAKKTLPNKTLGRG